MADYQEMWKGLGMDIEAHDGLLEVLPPLYQEVIIEQNGRPEAMAYFDNFFAEIGRAHV